MLSVLSIIAPAQNRAYLRRLIIVTYIELILAMILFAPSSPEITDILISIGPNNLSGVSSTQTSRTQKGRAQNNPFMAPSALTFVTPAALCDHAHQLCNSNTAALSDHAPATPDHAPSSSYEQWPKDQSHFYPPALSYQAGAHTDHALQSSHFASIESSALSNSLNSYSYRLLPPTKRLLSPIMPLIATFKLRPDSQVQTRLRSAIKRLTLS